MRLSNRTYAWIIGTGILFFAIHHPDQPLIEYTFLPAVGMLLLSIGTMMYIVNSWKSISLGQKRIWIPLLVIIASIIISSVIQIINNPELTAFQGLSPVAFGILLFGLYLVSRSVDRDIFTPFTYAVVIGAASCVVYGLILPGQGTGGLISPTNYDMATGLLVFGVVVSAIKRQWWLSAVAIVGLAFTGSPEALFAVGALGIIVIVRRDWSKKLLLPVAVIIIGFVSIFFFAKDSSYLYAYTGDKLETVAENQSEFAIDDALTGRWGRIKLAMSNIQPFGEGYTITDFTTYTVHNVPLVIVQQIGIVAAGAWLWVTLFCLVKTKWKYAWSAVLILSVFDHFIWTQVAPWWWALVGVSTTSTLKSDLIFRR